MNRKPSNRNAQALIRAVFSRRGRLPRRPLRCEPLEHRIALDGTGLFEGNAAPPDLDLSAIETQSVYAGQELVLDLYAAGMTVTDLDADGYPTGDTIRLQLDPDDTPDGATLDEDGIFRWTPTTEQVGTFELVVLAVDSGTPPLADAEIFLIEVKENSAPDLAAIDDTQISFNQLLEVTVTATDADGNGLTFLLDRDDPDSTLPAGATLETIDNNTAVIRWVPTEADGTGDYTFSVLVIDDGWPPLSDCEVFTVTVTEITGENNAPSALEELYSITSHRSLDVDAAAGVLANDSDSDGDSLTAVLISGPAYGALSLNADGSFTYTPQTGFSGIDGFLYSASDGSLVSEATAVTIQVLENHAPTAAEDEYEAVLGYTLTVDAADGLLANDSDQDGDPLTAVLVASPTYGTLSFNTDGSFTYTPGTDFQGTDTFTYTADDGAATSAETTVTISVLAENHAPTAVADAYDMLQGGTLTVEAAEGVLANDSDPDGQSLAATLVYGPSYGTITLNSNGSFTYTPGTDFYGSDSFSYVANDGFLTSESTDVTIAVRENHAPIATGETYEMEEDQTLTVDTTGGVLANDSDQDGDTITPELVTGPEHGTLTLSDDGSFTYTPGADYFGDDGFSYRVGDGALFSEAVTVSMTIAAVNDTPAGEGDTYDAIMNSTLTVDAAEGVLVNDTDIEGDSIKAVTVDAPSHGQLSLSEDGSFTYIPEADFQGTDSFTYKVNDGTLDSQPVTVTIQVQEAQGASGDPAESLRITEINYHPTDPTEEELLINSEWENDSFEFLEITNVSDVAVSLVGLVFDSGITFDFADATISELAAGESLLLVYDIEAFEARYGTDLNVVGQYEGKLNNGGERLTLLNALDIAILDFAYDDEEDWPTEADGGGYTLELTAIDADPSLPASWKIGELGGSPGQWAELMDQLLAT